MVTKSGLEGRKTNHGARKTCVQTLKDSNIADTDIAKVTGHKNIASLQAYYEPSCKKQKQISEVLTTAATNSMTKQKEPNTEITTSHFMERREVTGLGMSSMLNNAVINGNVTINFAK